VINNMFRENAGNIKSEICSKNNSETVFNFSKNSIDIYIQRYPGGKYAIPKLFAVEQKLNGRHSKKKETQF
jgi:hypothetical protein